MVTTDHSPLYSPYAGPTKKPTFTVTQFSACDQTLGPQQVDLRFLGPPSSQGAGRGSNPRQKDPCRSQGGVANHCNPV
ncbi:hypothetical protein PoB_004056600 [Plakobranchus ocellatus]|uniref:Uncharacterized protein n=1 Tax=Plakobranchus ocellatus TaxID=259542 RepID=A0AAV4B0M5_9GAST|nr:hypothetical protein PoB_004056600 [Plakobranchus ocellatus]